LTCQDGLKAWNFPASRFASVTFIVCICIFDWNFPAVKVGVMQLGFIINCLCSTGNKALLILKVIACVWRLSLSVGYKTVWSLWDTSTQGN